MPSQVIDELVPLLKSSYRICKVRATGGRAAFRPRRFRRAASVTSQASRSKSDFYRDALAMLNSGRITLPKNDRLFNQLVTLSVTLRAAAMM